MSKVNAVTSSIPSVPNNSAPLSDQTIANQLKADGMTVARRTVAKYREELKLLPSHMRKRAF